MGKVYTNLVESFGYLTEAPGDTGISNTPAGDPSTMVPGEVRHAPEYNPNSGSSYTGDIGDAPNDPAKPKKKDPTKNPYYDPNIAATQTMFNKLKITDNAGARLSVDGVWGWRTEEAKQNFFKKYPGNSPEGRQYDDTAEKVRQDLLWRVIPDKGTGKTARMGPDRSKGKDPAIGEPSPEAAKAMGISVTPPPGDAAQVTKPATGSNIPPELTQAVPNPKVGDEYWVNGSRYEFSPAVRTRGGSSPEGWRVTHRAGEFALNGATRRASSLGYTGPGDMVSMNKAVAQLDREKNQQAQLAAKESTELDIIRKLSGM